MVEYEKQFVHDTITSTTIIFTSSPITFYRGRWLYRGGLLFIEVDFYRGGLLSSSIKIVFFNTIELDKKLSKKSSNLVSLPTKKRLVQRTWVLSRGRLVKKTISRLWKCIPEIRRGDDGRRENFAANAW